MKLIYEVVMAQKGELDACNASLARHEELIHTQEKRIGDLEKIAHSQLIWRIEDYTRKVKEAKSGNTDTLFSPTFTTSKHGYRLCASICPNGDGKGKGTHLSVFISILRGKESFSQLFISSPTVLYVESEGHVAALVIPHVSLVNKTRLTILCQYRCVFAPKFFLSFQKYNSQKL